MDQRLANILERLGQADRALRDRGDDPEPFLLIYGGGMSISVHHRGWDDSWATPVAEDIDDLEELGHVRTEPARNAKRIFSLTVKGREQAAVLTDKRVPATGGRAPSLDQVLDWLREQEESEPANLESPGRLVPAAVRAGLVDDSGREALAARILDLHTQDYLSGDVPGFDQSTDEQRLGLSNGLRLTMKANDHARNAKSQAGSITFNGSVIAAQIAAGDITNYVSFGDLLDKAAAEIAELDDIEEEHREEALTLIDLLRGKAASASGEMLTGAGAALLATVLGQLLGFPSGM